MQRRQKLLLAGGIVVALAAGGTGIAVGAGVGDDDEAPITGDALDKASAAALDFTGGGQVTETEVDDEESYYEVEVTLDDGSQVDVQLDESFTVVGSSADHEDQGDDDDDDDCAAVADHDVAHDRAAHARAPGLARAGAVEAGEPLEDQLAVLRRDAGAVVGDGDLSAVAGLDHRQAHPAGGVAFGVLGQVAHRAGELPAVALDLGRRDAGG